MSVTGQPLPSPRAISINMHPDTNVPHVRYALMVMQFAQIMDHDLTNTPVYQGNCHAYQEKTKNELCYNKSITLSKA